MVQARLITATVLAVSCLAGRAAGQKALPRVIVNDTSVVADNPEFVWLASALRQPPTLRGGMRLVYPDSLRRRGIAGRVLLEFVVDAQGRVEPGVRVLRTAHPLLAGPAKQMLMGARFEPGRARGRPVRVLMQMGLRVAPTVTTAGSH